MAWFEEPSAGYRARELAAAYRGNAQLSDEHSFPTQFLAGFASVPAIRMMNRKDHADLFTGFLPHDPHRLCHVAVVADEDGAFEAVLESVGDQTSREIHIGAFLFHFPVVDEWTKRGVNWSRSCLVNLEMTIMGLYQRAIALKRLDVGFLSVRRRIAGTVGSNQSSEVVDGIEGVLRSQDGADERLKIQPAVPGRRAFQSATVEVEAVDIHSGGD